MDWILLSLNRNYKRDQMWEPGESFEWRTGQYLKRYPQIEKFVVKNFYLLCNVAGIIVGFVVGLLARFLSIEADGVLWLGLPGEIYIRIVKCIIVPLIVCSVIDGMANTEPKINLQLGVVFLSFMLFANSMGACLGLFWSIIFQPGYVFGEGRARGAVDSGSVTTQDLVADFIRNLFPPNLIGAALHMSQTQYRYKQEISEVNINGYLFNQTSTEVIRSIGIVHNMNLVGLVVLSTAIGVAASQTGQHGRPVVEFFKAGGHILFRLFYWIKWSTPLGSASLVAASIATLKDVGPALRAMSLFSVLLAVVNLGIMQLFGMSIVFFLVYFQNPMSFFKKSAGAWLIAFGATSSALPYPEFVRVADEFNVDHRVIQYILPLSISLNKCGSASFITSVCVFVTQYTGVGNDLPTTITIGFFGILASLGIPMVNSASVVAVVIFLESLGVPTKGTVGLIMAMEWLNDRVRTTSNAMSHMLCVLVTWKLCKRSFVPRILVETVPESAEDKCSNYISLV